MSIETVGVVGAGTMGAGIAQLAIEAGHVVLLHDGDRRVVDRATERIRAGIARRAARHELGDAATQAWVDERMDRLRPADEIDRLAGASDLVIEAAVEDLEVKRGLFETLDAAAPPDAILATNTSALSVAAIGSRTLRPGRLLGLHFFNPAPIMPLVEVVLAPATEPDVASRASVLMTAWGKTPVRCVDSPGFIVNRVNRPFTLEPLAMLHAGEITVVRGDEVIRGAAFPMGPFELMDLVGLDVNLAAARSIHEAVLAAARGGQIADRFRPSPIQERMVAAGHLGRKMSGGFYRYDASGAAVGPAREYDIAEDEVRAIDDAAIVERVVLSIINEAYRALGEGIATAADIDLALRLGAGHPVGPFERVGALGGPVGVLGGLRRHAGEGPRFDPAPALVRGASNG